MVGFAYLAYSAKEENNKNEAFIYTALAILFQPFFKIALGRTIWNLVDVMVSIGLMVTVINDSKNELKR